MTLLDDLTATHWHVSRAARDGVPPHRRLEIATMSKSTKADVAAIVARLTEFGAHVEAATVTALATDLDASRLLGPHRDWWADIAASVGRSCVTLPDVAVAVRDVVARKDAEIERLRECLAEAKRLGLEACETADDAIDSPLDANAVGRIGAKATTIRTALEDL